MAAIIKHIIKFLGWLFLAVVSVALNCWAIIEHYLSAKGALELQGVERQEIWRDKLVGQVFGAFVPGATLPMAMALTIAAGEAICLLIVFNYLFRIFDLFRNWREYRIQKREITELETAESQRWDDSQAAKLADQRKVYEAEMRGYAFKITEAAAALALFIFILVYAVSYEMELFRYRSMAGIVAADSQGQRDNKTNLPKKPDSPEKQAVNMPAWEYLPSDRLRRFSYQLAQAGALGYLAFTALCCLALEQSLRKSGEQFDQVHFAFTQQQPALTDDGSEYAASPDPPPDDSGTNVVSNPWPAEPDPVQPTAFAAEPEFEPRATEVPPPTAERRADEPATQEVIGRRGERVSREQARRDSHRYYVNPVNGEIWDRATWERLHGPEDGSQDGDPEAPRAKGAAN